MLDHDIWHPGVCAICLKAGVVAPFTVHDTEDAPYFYACAACYLERLDGVNRPATPVEPDHDGDGA